MSALSHLRICDFTGQLAGAGATKWLAAFGAEVIRIESAKRADLYRRLPVHDEELPVTLNSSGMFNQWNQGKFSVAVELIFVFSAKNGVVHCSLSFLVIAVSNSIASCAKGPATIVKTNKYAI